MRHIQDISNRNNGIIFYLFLVCYCFSSLAVIVSKIGLDQTYINLLRYSFLIFSICIMAFSTIYFTYKEKSVIIISVISCTLTIVLSHSTWSIVLINSLYLIIYCRRLTLSDIASAIMFGNIVILIFTLPLVFFSDTWGAFDPRYGIRATYGFTSPNIVAMYLFSLYAGLMLYLYACIKSKVVAVLFLTLFLAILSLLINDTVSRTSILFLILSYVFFIFSLFSNWNKKHKFLSYSTATILIIICSFQVYTSFNYNADMGVINLALSNRIGLGSFLFQGEGLPKFAYGIDIEPYSPIDFFFIAYIYSLGIFFSAFLFILLLMRLCSIKINMAIFAICIGGILSTLTERQFLIPLCSIMLYIVYSKEFDEK